MKCRELAKRIEKLQPEALPHEVARLCLLLSNSVDDLDKLADEETLLQMWHGIKVRLDAVTDQHAAMTAELEKLSRTNPETLTADQLLVLIRAIKVQSQVLQLYVGQPSLEAGTEK
jgi:hypothetical protein